MYHKHLSDAWPFCWYNSQIHNFIHTVWLQELLEINYTRKLTKYNKFRILKIHIQLLRNGYIQKEVGACAAISKRQIIVPIFFQRTLTTQCYCTEILELSINQLDNEETQNIFPTRKGTLSLYSKTFGLGTSENFLISI